DPDLELSAYAREARREDVTAERLRLRAELTLTQPRGIAPAALREVDDEPEILRRVAEQGVEPAREDDEIRLGRAGLAPDAPLQHDRRQEDGELGGVLGRRALRRGGRIRERRRGVEREREADRQREYRAVDPAERESLPRSGSRLTARAHGTSEHH